MDNVKYHRVVSGRDKQVVNQDLGPFFIGAPSKTDSKTQKKTIWSVTNYASGGMFKGIVHLVHCGIKEIWWAS